MCNIANGLFLCLKEGGTLARDFAEKFYNSKEWLKCRAAYLASVNGLCEKCFRAALIVHHKKPLNEDNINDPQITLSFDNLQALCLDCHNEVHGYKNKEKSIQDGYAFTADGDIIAIPPGSHPGRAKN